MTKTRLPVVHRATPGRPEYSDKVRQKLLRGLKAGMTRTAAAGFADIAKSTLFDWLDRDPEFKAAVEKAEGVAEARYTATIAHQGISRQDAATALKWLERRRPADWREQVRVIEASEPEADMSEADLDELRGLVAERQRRRAEQPDPEAEPASADVGGEG